VEESGSSTLFRHVLEPYYVYSKEVKVLSENVFKIEHQLKALIPWEGTVYNHNFFTMGKLAVGPSRRIGLPFAPEGTWRTAYDSVGFTDGGIRFSRGLVKGESVYAGDIHAAGQEGMPYDLTLTEAPLSVRIQGDVPVTHTVLWANHRIACLEPYNAFSAIPGKPFSWTLRYTFNKQA
jgi:hypothetical protein